jgi:hypothetical protein
MTLKFQPWPDAGAETEEISLAFVGYNRAKTAFLVLAGKKRMALRLEFPGLSFEGDQFDAFRFRGCSQIEAGVPPVSVSRTALHLPLFFHSEAEAEAAKSQPQPNPARFALIAIPGPGMDRPEDLLKKHTGLTPGDLAGLRRHFQRWWGENRLPEDKWEILELLVRYELRFANGDRAWLQDAALDKTLTPDELDLFDRMEGSSPTSRQAEARRRGGRATHRLVKDRSLHDAMREAVEKVEKLGFAKTPSGRLVRGQQQRLLQALREKVNSNYKKTTGAAPNPEVSDSTLLRWYKKMPRRPRSSA